MRNKEGGFLHIIILLVIFLFIMKYFDISLYDIFNWFMFVIYSIFSKLNLMLQ